MGIATDWSGTTWGREVQSMTYAICMLTNCCRTCDPEPQGDQQGGSQLGECMGCSIYSLDDMRLAPSDFFLNRSLDRSFNMYDYNMPGSWSAHDTRPSSHADVNAYEYTVAAELDAAPNVCNVPRTAPMPTTHRVLPQNPYGYNPFGFPEPSSADPSNAQTRPSQPRKIIVVFGRTGAGKTSLIKAATGVDLEVGHNLNSCEHICLLSTKC